MARIFGKIVLYQEAESIVLRLVVNMKEDDKCLSLLAANNTMVHSTKPMTPNILLQTACFPSSGNNCDIFDFYKFLVY